MEDLLVHNLLDIGKKMLILRQIFGGYVGVSRVIEKRFSRLRSCRILSGNFKPVILAAVASLHAFSTGASADSGDTFFLEPMGSLFAEPILSQPPRGHVIPVGLDYVVLFNTSHVSSTNTTTPCRIFVISERDNSTEQILEGSTDCYLTARSDVDSPGARRVPYAFFVKTLTDDQIVQLYRTDGTTLGTEPWMSLADEGGPEGIYHWVQFANGTILMTARNSQGTYGLWVIRDGQRPEPFWSPATSPSGPNFVGEFASVNGFAYIIAIIDGMPGLVRTDGDFVEFYSYPQLGLESIGGWNRGVYPLGDGLMLVDHVSTVSARLVRIEFDPLLTTVLHEFPVGLVIDPYFGLDDSNVPNQFLRAGDRYVFHANDGIHGREVWVTDGTPEGTRLLYDAISGSLGGLVELVGEAGDRALFTTYASLWSLDARLWTTDGTAAGTVPLLPVELENRSYWLLADGRSSIAGYLLFLSGSGIWASKGTPESTRLIFPFMENEQRVIIPALTNSAWDSIIILRSIDQAGFQPWRIGYSIFRTRFAEEIP